MKKTLFILLALALLGTSIQAQFTHKGVRFGLGTASISDDLLTRSPILGANLGGYVNYGFENAQSFWADNFYLQFGFDFTRRGSNFEQEWIGMRSYREGYFHNYYAQLSATACWRWELPVAQADHVVNFYAGPAFGVGLFGRYWDRQVTPGNPQSSVNFDTYVTTDKYQKRAFRHMRRLDASSILGIGYQRRNITIDLFWQHGFVALQKETDVLRDLDITQNGGNTVTTTDQDGNSTTNHLSNRNAYSGTNQAFILSIGYQLPIK